MIRNCHAPTSLWAVCALLFALCSPALAFELTGKAVQGGLMFGKATPGSRAQLDDDEIIVSRDGRFVLGFGRDESGVKTLVVTEPGGETRRRDLEIAKREYRIERVDGLPPKTVTPDPESLARIREDARKVREARARRAQRAASAMVVQTTPLPSLSITCQPDGMPVSKSVMGPLQVSSKGGKTVKDTGTCTSGVAGSSLWTHRLAE